MAVLWLLPDIGVTHPDNVLDSFQRTHVKAGGFVMGMPLPWHKRHALMLAGQLPENSADARLIVEAVVELLDTFLDAPADEREARPDNVLPFATG